MYNMKKIAKIKWVMLVDHTLKVSVVICCQDLVVTEMLELGAPQHPVSAILPEIMLCPILGTLLC